MNDMTTEVETGAEVETEIKSRKRRAPQGPRAEPQARPAYVVLQLLDNDGKPIAVNKKNINVITTERDSSTILEMIDSGQHENAFYLRVMVPPGR